MSTRTLTAALIVGTLAGSAAATPSPRELAMQDLPDDYPVVEFQLAHAAPTPVGIAPLGEDGARVDVDLTAAADAAKSGGIMGHLQRNWGRWLGGILAAGTVVAVGEHNDWGSSSSSRSTPPIVNNGTIFIVQTGDGSPVSIRGDEHNEAR